MEELEMKTIAMTVVLAVALIGAPARAQMAGHPHTDPNAPCFRWPAVDMDQDGVFDRVDHCPNTPKGAIVDQYGCPKDTDGDGVYDGIDQCPDTPRGTKVDRKGCPESRAAVTPPVEHKPAPVEHKPAREMERQLIERGKIRLENIYFETGKAVLLPESETTLREAGETLEKYPMLEIEVQGHTDTRGSDRYNLQLSSQRAAAVRAYLLEHFRLRPDHLVAKGYGETEPETRERNDEELLRNRRVELHVLNPEALPKGTKVENEK
jgi:OOP family OmpA-OmpF porin